MRENANERIRKAMLDNERQIREAILKANRAGNGWQFWAIARCSMYRAMERLEAKGLVKYNRRGGWGNPRRGYWLVSQIKKEGK